MIIEEMPPTDVLSRVGPGPPKSRSLRRGTALLTHSGVDRASRADLGPYPLEGQGIKHRAQWP